MRFIIDTHAFIWFVNDSDNLSNDARFVIESEADLWISSASLWEIAIKVSLGKLILPKPYQAFITRQLAINEIEIIYPTIKHLNCLSQLPFHHRDPFDRLMIAQAIVENVPIISKDSAFHLYEVEHLW
ncbi:MAG: type II toxin-antitoxin system VapC family toxin [Crocosphaera sp.]